MMRLLVVLVAIAVLVSSTAFAQRAGTIAIFSDSRGTNCNFFDGGVEDVYIFHIFHEGATGSQFMLDVSLTDWSWMADTWAFPSVLGTSVSGVTISYGACLSAPTFLGWLEFDAYIASTPTCTPIRIVAHPASTTGEIVGTDCAENVTFPTGGQGIVNPGGSCWCSPPVPVEQTTWGQVKSLYN